MRRKPIQMPDAGRLDVIRRAHARASFYVGEGEMGGNNRGPFVDVILESRGRGWAWCALLARRCYLDAFGPYYHGLRYLVADHPWLWRVPPRFDDEGRETIGVPEPGALRLVSGLAGVGRQYKDPAHAIPGDLIVYRRKDGHHAMIVDAPARNGIVRTIEGNVGKPPTKPGEVGAPVQLFHRDPTRDTGFRFFATLRRKLL